MATNYIILIFFLLLSLTPPSVITSPTDSPKSHELEVAIDEMTTANHFTFVTLLSMSLPDHRFQANVTFLMPNDRILSKSNFDHNSLSDFILHHSIPSPLLFDHLQRIPSGSTIPSSDPDFMLDINNNGRTSFFINNVRIISPNICSAGSSIRCHGIDGVLAASTKHTTLTSCPNVTSPVVVAVPPATALPPAAPPLGDHDHIIVGSPQPTRQVGLKNSSGGCTMVRPMSVQLVMIFASILIFGFNLLLL